MIYHSLALMLFAQDDDEMLMALLFAYYEQQLRKPRILHERLALDSLTDSAFVDFFRFSRTDFRKLLVLLQFPADAKLADRHKVSGEVCLLVLLRRLTYPARYCDLGRFFGRSNTAICLIFNFALNHVYGKTRHLLQFDWQRLDAAYLEKMGDLVQAKGGMLDDCVGFIDGTVRAICRPGRNQRPMYSGHKRVHAVKFQNITFPDGMVVFMDGPYAGNRHDSGILRESGLGEILEANLRGVDGRQLCIYGDPAYPDRDYLVCPYKGSQITDAQAAFNSNMADVRISVEWNFGKILSIFPFVDFKKNLKLHLQPVSKYYLVAALFSNCHTCFYGSQVTRHFNSTRPTIEEYLNLH